MIAPRPARTVKDRGHYRAQAAARLHQAHAHLVAAEEYLAAAKDDTWAKGRPGRRRRAESLAEQVAKLRAELVP